MTFEGEVGNISVNGKVYSLENMDWHVPSLHTINGQRYPLEMHLVHKSDAGGDLAVIAVLYQYGAPDSFYFQVPYILQTLDLKLLIDHNRGSSANTNLIVYA
jgi:carbonic anhydrase